MTVLSGRKPCIGARWKCLDEGARDLWKNPMTTPANDAVGVTVFVGVTVSEPNAEEDAVWLAHVGGADVLIGLTKAESFTVVKAIANPDTDADKVALKHGDAVGVSVGLAEQEIVSVAVAVYASVTDDDEDVVAFFVSVAHPGFVFGSITELDFYTDFDLVAVKVFDGARRREGVGKMTWSLSLW